MSPYWKLYNDLQSDSKSPSTFESLKNYISYVIFSVDSYEYYVPPLDSVSLITEFAEDIYMEILDDELVLQIPGFSRYIKRRLKGYALGRYLASMNILDSTDLDAALSRSTPKRVDKDKVKRYINTIFIDYCKYRPSSSEHKYYSKLYKSYMYEYFEIDDREEAMLDDLDEYARFLVSIAVDKVGRRYYE